MVGLRSARRPTQRDPLPTRPQLPQHEPGATIDHPMTTREALDARTMRLDRPALASRGRRLEYFTIIWNSLEGLIAVIAGVVAGSISLVGFGVDSFIEVTSGTALL